MLERLEGLKFYLVMAALVALELAGPELGVDPGTQEQIVVVLLALGGAAAKDAYDRSNKIGIHKS